MPRASLANAVVAITYSDGKGAASQLCRITKLCHEFGLRCVGFIESREGTSDLKRCDMVLCEISTEKRTLISEDRGPSARGCRLAVHKLLDAVGSVQEQLAQDPDLLILNKFGKIECEGGGIRALVSDAVERRIPVVLAVPVRCLFHWREFIGPFAMEFEASRLANVDDLELLGILGLSFDPHPDQAKDFPVHRLEPYN